MSTPLNVVREGSSLYYSLLWTEPAAKGRFTQRLMLIKALATTLDDVQEPQVAEKKIHWWHEELQRLNDGTARHPATQANQDCLKGNSKAQSACLDIVSVAATQRFTPADTTASSETDMLKSYRARLALLAHALSADEADLDITSHTALAALGFGQHEQLIRLASLIHRGLPVFSDELYAQFGIRPHDLAELIRIDASAGNDADAQHTPETQTTTNLKSIPINVEKPGREQLLRHVIKHNSDTLSQAVADKTTEQRYRRAPLLPLWRLLVLRKYQLDLWNKQQPNLLREHTTLTPITKLYRAWQNKR